MKTQTKTALIIGAYCMLIVVLFGVTIYYFQNKYAYVDFYKRLETRARISANYNLDSDLLNAEALGSLRVQYLEKLEKEREYVIEANAHTSLDSIALANKLPIKFLQKLWENQEAEEKVGSAFYSGIKFFAEGKYYLVVVSAENYYVTHHLLFLRNILLVSILLLVVVVVSLSLYFAKHIFDPIKIITKRVKQINTENIHLRVGMSPNNSDINELAATFNDLLSRIETALEIQKNFISNASHELATPLTTIIGEADLALLKERSREEYEGALQRILFQAERLDEITKSLLFLAQTGYKGKAIAFERVRLDEVIWETKELINRLNKDSKIFVDLSLTPDDPRKLKVMGNRQLLRLALANVLNNACKYSNNELVTVFIASSDSHVIVTIRDQGIGIPQTEMEHIYDPFFRASNTVLYEGYGIGLPLTQNIVHLHGGSLLVSSVIGKGTSVQIKIPLAQL